ncbi:MAG: Re/Si-specific NAD(P)(+) transhydrogenase subunit alpha [Propionibacteriaceae bacterium]|jgi:NAD(P) transhydrogenase subunit alpha|nr:Re/Si-specific NAD(P)(+) transhydrogenase subunit alpha [Propionibacteriaceae bacterium]
MRVGVPCETAFGENRVAVTDKSVAQLRRLGYDVVVEQGAGLKAGFTDAAYQAAGAATVARADAWGADIVLRVGTPDTEEFALLSPQATLIGFLDPRFNTEIVARCAAAGITALSMDMIPRTSRAQSMDALSSMANISGYRAVVEAVHAFGRFLGGQVTAAGKVPPANVFIVGTGVAGLAAIGVAGNLGAVVRATDVRPETAEQVESMGAVFVAAATTERDQGVSADGYAKETSADYNARAAMLYAEQVKWADIVVTTAAIPGKPSPKLITAEMVATMAPGSVIVDLAATGGGNCELTEPGVSYVTANGVAIIGYTDMASRLAGQSSQLYARNVANLVALMTPHSDGQLQVDFDDDIIRTATITKAGEVTFPPPPVQVSVAPSAAVSPVPTPAPAPTPESPPAKPPRPWLLDVAIVAVLSVGLTYLLSFAPAPVLGSLAVFALATVAGYYVVWNVTSALHTPLMSLSNAISGIIIVGAMTQLASPSWPIRILAVLAVVVATVNVVGGFVVTNRMVSMFKRA